MAVKFGKRNHKQNNVFYTIIIALLLCALFLGMMGYLYNKAQNDAYESLHVQTKQVKDDIILQLTSDRENLATMANFAAKLYRDGEDYSLLFESFKSIGMIENIGILNPDDTLSTKSGTIPTNGVLSFAEEKEKGTYISGKIPDVTKENYDLIRSAVPITVNGETVGILYGVIKPDKLRERYKNMVDELDAQLFVYEQSSGDMLIDTIKDEFVNISALKNRKYTEGTTYEQLVTTDKGFVSFRSAYTDETLHLHYSTIDEFGWMIAMGRYDSQVFAETHNIAQILFIVFITMLGIIALYILTLMIRETKSKSVIECASNVRKELLETVNGQNNIQDALMEICKFAKARSAIFFDTNGEFYHYIAPQYEERMLTETERQYFLSELFRYAAEFHNTNENAVNVLCITPNKHLETTNPDFYTFLQGHEINEISFSATINKANHITILAAVNSKNGIYVRALAEKVSACFSMALHNKNHLNQTTLAATTDALTGALNRVSYKNDMMLLDEEKPLNFSCIYVDVNELHLCNNKYGHAAGDEMLIYIANTLKEIFYGHKIYRIGGDEYLVFCRNIDQETIKNNLEIFNRQLKTRNYHVAVGMSYRTQNTDTEAMVKEAETRMYEAKAEYYQTKEQLSAAANNEFLQIATGIPEIDTMLSVLKESYNGIYRVSLDTDKAKRILMPAYLGYNENEDHFSTLFSKYVSDSVKPDYHRAVMNFLNYDALKHHLSEGNVPTISYKKNDDELVVLSVYKLGDTGNLVEDTLWVFARA